MSDPKNASEADRHLPLKPVVFHILLALVEKDLHGYGVIQEVRERSEGRIQLQTGPFYRHLKKLMDAGIIDETSQRPAEDDPRRGSYYQLTLFGRDVVRAEAGRLATLVSASAALGLTDRGNSK
jgi:DNA-binding PadR family transcriptional regulator